MKHTRKRILSLMMSGIMTASLLPSYLSELPVSADPITSSLTIDFDANAPDAETVLQQMFYSNYKQSYYQAMPPIMGSWSESGCNSIYERYRTLPWRHVTNWTCNNDPETWSYWIWDGNSNPEEGGSVSHVARVGVEVPANMAKFEDEIQPNSLRAAMESTNPADTYVALAADDSHAETHRDPWNPIVISENKVLDLNGHTIDIRFDRNRDNDSDHNQNHTDMTTHYCNAFTITNGATLTIIDSSAWRGENNGKGTGRINFTGYMVDPYSWDIDFYTTRDMFYVDDGNLVVYGGHFQAGRSKHQKKKNFSWEKLRTTIGQAVELGVGITEYATGLNLANAQYNDVLARMNQQYDSTAAASVESGGSDDNHSANGKSDMTPRDGQNGGKTVDLNSQKRDMPTQQGGREQTVGEKTKNGEENKKDDKKDAKDDKHTAIAKAQNEIINKATDKNAIGGMVDKAFGLVDSIAGMVGTDQKSLVTQSIKGTVVKCGTNGTFVSYGGFYEGYGSTPNVRNAVVELVVSPAPEGSSDRMTWDHSKYQGGVAYIYDGDFQAYCGANVFNFVRENTQDRKALIKTRREGWPTAWKTVTLTTRETGGIEEIFYENQDILAGCSEDENGVLKDASGNEVTPIPIGTSNVQVRGGTFRCFYDLMNVAITEDSDDEKFYKFPGTMGSVNLGPESFNSELIKDGRIQIVDRYGDGALVLMDEYSKDEAGNNGLYHYRLFCGDYELRYKSYLEVYPNNDPQISASNSIRLSVYDGKERSTKELFTDDKKKENIRAPYRQTEFYFDYMFDDDRTKGNISVMPDFWKKADENQTQAQWDVYGEYLRESEVWYYPEPLSARSGKPYDKAKVELGNMPYANFEITYKSQKDGSYRSFRDRDKRDEDDWDGFLDYYDKDQTSYFEEESFSKIRRNLHYFTYKIYAVDPLTRENIGQMKWANRDEPLITVRYGDSEDSLKCKLPLTKLEQELCKRNGLNYDAGQHYFQAGDMYRIVLTVDEYMRIGDGYGPQSSGAYLQSASTSTSILFRCYSKYETEDTGEFRKINDFTPLRWKYTTPKDLSAGEKYDTIKADSEAWVDLVHAKAGMTDIRGDVKTFDLYYQWWEVDENGDPLRLIAGTNNIYESWMGPRSEHNPEHWNPRVDGKTYINTVNPADPNAEELLKNNGLPKDYTTWTKEQIHVYSDATVKASELTSDGTDNLWLGNNFPWATKCDSCYIPESMAGKYLRVCCIVLCPDWPLAYDPKQTFWSHTVKVEGLPDLKPEISINYKKNESQQLMDYSTYEKSATIRLTNNMRRIDRLTDGEYIDTITYQYENVKGGKVLTKEITGLHLTKGNLSDQPKLIYPNDFYPEGTDLSKISPADIRIRVKYKTTKYGKPFRESDYSEPKILHYHVEAEEIMMIGDKIDEITLDQINGDYSFDIPAFQPMPLHADIGYDFKNYTNTDPSVAFLDEKGYIQFTGSAGETTISVENTDGTTLSKTIRVLQNYDQFNITGIKAPVIGEKFDTESIAIPDDAMYHIKDIKWYQGDKELDKDAVAEYYKPYTVLVTLESNDGYWASEQDASYFLLAEQPDGDAPETVDMAINKTNYAWQDSDIVNGKNVYRQTFNFKYTYAAQTDHEGKTIDKIYMDFPTEVPEGTNYDDWLKEVHVYTDGYNEGITFEITPTLSEDARSIAASQGCDDSRGDIVRIRSFIKELQNGVQATIRIPDELIKLGDVFAENITLYVNGKESGSPEVYHSGMIYASARDTLTVTDGKPVAEMPAYQMLPVSAVSDETIYLDALLICDNPNVKVKLDESTLTDEFKACFAYDTYAGTVTPHFEGKESGSYSLYYTVTYDADGDGMPEYVIPGDYYFPEIITNPEDAPKYSISGSATITMLDPEGKEAEKDDYSFTGSPYNMMISIPELNGAFISEICDASGEKITDAKNGADRIVGNFIDGESYTVKTVSADCAEIGSTDNSVFVSIKDPDGNEISGIQLSLDGEHFIKGDRITGLTPDTEYNLYFRQGTSGRTYLRTFRTAKQNYDIYVGRIPVTDSNLGDLDYDGWHYDIETKTLTLKNFTLKDCGTLAFSVQTGGEYPVNQYAVIVSKDELTVNLIGENYLELTPTSGAVLPVIYSEKDVTITGNGSLTFGNGTMGSAGIYSKTGDINLNSTGTLNFDRIMNAFYPENGKVNYTNGTILYSPAYFDDFGVLSPVGGLILGEMAAAMDFSNAVHKLSFFTGDSEEAMQPAKENDVLNCFGKYALIIPEHHDVNKNVTEESHGSGSCDKECKYYLSCDCGHIGTETFTLKNSEHSLLKHPTRAATCKESGVKEYWECTLCGERFADNKGAKPLTDADTVIPALGHDLEHHDETKATCSENGICEHWACKRCGERYADAAGTLLLSGVDTITPATGHDWIHFNKKAATCTADGMAEHWKCANCGEYSADKDGKLLLKEDDLKTPATGHNWGEWSVTKEASESDEGEKVRVCSFCGETETKIIEQLTTTTTTTTTTTSTTKPTTTTTTTTSTTKPTTTTTTTTTTSTTKPTTTTTTTTSTTKPTTTTTTTTTTSTTKPTTTTTTTTTTSTTKPTTTTTTTTTSTTKKTTTTTTTSTTKATTTTSTTKATTTTATSTTKKTTTTTTSTTKPTTTTTTTTSTTKLTTTTTTTASTTKKTTTTTTTTTSTTKPTTTTTTTTSTTKLTTTTTTTTSTTKPTTTTTTTTTSTTKPTTTTTTTTTSMTTTTTESTTGSSMTESTESTMTTSDTTPTEPEYLTGDINDDGEISVEDAQLALLEYVNAMTGLESSLTEKQKLAGDVNGDKEISVEDAQTILLYYVSNTLSGETVTWDDLLGKKPQGQQLPFLVKLKEFVAVAITEDET